MVFHVCYSDMHLVDFSYDNEHFLRIEKEKCSKFLENITYLFVPESSTC